MDTSLLWGIAYPLVLEGSAICPFSSPDKATLIKDKVRNVFLTLGLVVLLANAAFAEDRPTMRYTLLYNSDVYHSEENFFTNRLDALVEKRLEVKGYSLPIKIIPFASLRRNVERHRNERVCVGTEFGAQFFPQVYMGEELRYVWRNESLYAQGEFVDAHMAEAVTRLVFSTPVYAVMNRQIKCHFGSEYTYDFGDGQATRNELIAGLTFSLFENLTANIGWRHRDRVHYYDCDTLEGSIAYSF